MLGIYSIEYKWDVVHTEIMCSGPLRSIAQIRGKQCARSACG